jgi:hypothetical protein
MELYINLMSGETSISNTPYRLSTLELKELQMKLEELLKKGYICRTVSLWGAQFLFVKKKEVTMRLCIDFVRTQI